MKQLGLCQSVALTHDIEGFLVYFMPYYLGWTPKEITNNAATGRREFSGKPTLFDFAAKCDDLEGRREWRLNAPDVEKGHTRAEPRKTRRWGALP